MIAAATATIAPEPPSSNRTGAGSSSLADLIASVSSALHKNSEETGLGVVEKYDFPMHDLQENNRHFTPAFISTPCIPEAPFSLTDHQGITIGGLQFVPVDSGQYLNHSSLDQLLSHRTVLSADKMMKLSALVRKRTHYPDTYRYENYFSQCSLISLLEQSYSQSVCFCGLKPGNSNDRLASNSTGLCNKPRLCWHCARNNVRNTLRTFQPVFFNHDWGFLTISYDGSLPFGPSSDLNWTLYWEAAKSALKRLVGTGAISGAMVREELAVLSLCPTIVQPHLHAIVPVSELSEGSVELLSRWTSNYTDDLGESVALKPSIVFKPVTTEDGFEGIVHYIHKPIDFVSPYRARWDDKLDAKDKATLNRAARDIIEASVAVPKGRFQIDYLGNMRAGAISRLLGFRNLSGTNYAEG